MTHYAGCVPKIDKETKEVYWVCTKCRAKIWWGSAITYREPSYSCEGKCNCSKWVRTQDASGVSIKRK